MHRVEESLRAGQQVSAQVQADVLTHQSVQITHRLPSALYFIITSKEIRRMLGLSQRLHLHGGFSTCVLNWCGIRLVLGQVSGTETEGVPL